MDEKELEALKASNPKAYELIVSQKNSIAEREKADKDAKDKKELEDKNKNKPDDEDALRKKVREEAEAKDKAKGSQKQMETALQFNMSVDNFIKDNADLLPAEFPALVQAAGKESYDSAQEKSRVLKVSFITSFFQVKDHLEALTPSQKSTLDDFFKLTKTGKEEKAEGIYENIFEPALTMLKRVKKAEELGKARSGFAGASKVGEEYKQRLIKGSKKTYLREKGDTK